MSGDAEDAVPALAGVQGLKPLVTAFQGTVLDPTQPQYRQSDGLSYDHEPEMFTRGSAPRPLTAVAGRGATLRLSDGSELIDLCSMTENTVLGLNDPG